MVFHWSLGDNKSPQVSRTLLSVLVVLNNAVVWMVSTRPPTSKSSSPFNCPIVTVPNAPITIGIIVTIMFYSFFSSLARSKYLFIFSFSFSFILLLAGTAKSTILPILFFLRGGDYYKVWSSGRDEVIRLYIKVLLEFVCIILQDCCWVVHIPFVHMVKFQFLAHFPVDHLGHPVVSRLKLFQCYFAAFAYYAINGFVSIIT